MISHSLSSFSREPNGTYMFIFISHLLDEKYFKVPSIQTIVIKQRWDTDNRMIQA